MHIETASTPELQAELDRLQRQYQQLRDKNLKLDLTRGKPGLEQVALADGLDGILKGNFIASDGSDTRNYGGIDGLPEAKALFGALLDAAPEETLIGGNSSLSLMYQLVDFAMFEGIAGSDSAWGNAETPKFLCPSPGYDRHFAICEHVGVEMIPVPMLDSGPDMDEVEALLREDADIKGIWCVPRFSNPTGCVYSDETVDRLAKLALIAGDHFAIMWDNAYAVHTLSDKAPALASIAQRCREHGTQNSLFQFGSTSKVTMAGAGVAFMSSSAENLKTFKDHLGYQTIGPDKVNQLRHVKFLQDRAGIDAHMAQHAALIKPRFAAVLDTLERELSDSVYGTWTKPEGGYFISFDASAGLAKEIVQLASDIGVKLTPAGATYPYGEDPNDSNIRLAPTFPSAADVQASVDAFVICVKLATVKQRLGA